MPSGLDQLFGERQRPLWGNIDGNHLAGGAIGGHQQGLSRLVGDNYAVHGGLHKSKGHFGCVFNRLALISPVFFDFSFL